MQEVVGIKLPQSSMAVLGHKVAQEQVDGVLLLCICVGIAVETANGSHEVSGLCGSLPVPSLPLEEGGVGFRPAVLHTDMDRQLSILPVYKSMTIVEIATCNVEAHQAACNKATQPCMML